MQTAQAPSADREGAEQRPTRGSTELDEILLEDGAIAKAIRQHFSRSVLWRFRTGRRVPEFEAMKLLRKLTQGRLAFDAWAEDTARKRCTACGRAG